MAQRHASLLASAFRLLHFSADEGGNRIVRDERDTAKFPTITNPNEPPIAEFLTSVIKAASNAEERIAAALRQSKCFRTRSTPRRFAWRDSHFRMFAGFY